MATITPEAPVRVVTASNWRASSPDVLLQLDHLPRGHFLGAVLAAATGADEARERLVREVELAEMTVHPQPMPVGSRHRVHLDAQLETPGVLAAVETKPVQSLTQHAEHVAQLVTALSSARGQRAALALLVLDEAPPYRVGRRGTLGLQGLMELGAGELADRGQPLATIPDADSIAWLTWARVREVVTQQRDSFECSDPSVHAAVNRLATSFLGTIR